MAERFRRRRDESEEDFEARKAEAIAAGPEEPHDKPPKSTAATRSVPEAALKDTCTILSGIIGMVSPPDALNEHECNILVSGAMASQKSSPTFRKYLARFVGVTAGASFFGAVAIIAFARMQRHGMIPGTAGLDAGMPMPGSAEPLSGDPYWNQQEWARNHPEPAQEPV